jgi:membrane protease YdiL (CAAX protease family)
MSSSAPQWFTFIAVALVAPVFEELIYRGLILRKARVVSDRFAVFFSAAVFALTHGFLDQAVSAFPLALLWGLIYVKTGKLRNTILLHMAFNGFNMMLEYASDIFSIRVTNSLIASLCIIGLVLFPRFEKRFSLEYKGLDLDEEGAVLRTPMTLWCRIVLGLGILFCCVMSACAVF